MKITNLFILGLFARMPLKPIGNLARAVGKRAQSIKKPRINSLSIHMNAATGSSIMDEIKGFFKKMFNDKGKELKYYI